MLIVFYGSRSFAQGRFRNIHHYKSFELLAEGGFAHPTSAAATGGLLLAIEPRWNIIDQLTVGLRVERSSFSRRFSDAADATGVTTATPVWAVLPVVDYYFGNRTVRPFMGAGGGWYSIAAIKAGTPNNILAAPAASTFGGMVRLGLEAGPVRAALHYHLVPATNGVRNQYAAASFAIILGGGLKEEYQGRY